MECPHLPSYPSALSLYDQEFPDMYFSTLLYKPTRALAKWVRLRGQCWQCN
jgi:hypothetical protein